MSTGRFGAGVETAFGAAFADELQKVAAKKGFKKGRKKEKPKSRPRKNRFLRALTGAGIGAGLGASVAAGAHGAKYLERRALYNLLRPYAALVGPEASSVLKKHFKPKFVRRSLFKHMGAGGLAGAVPAAALASLL